MKTSFAGALLVTLALGFEDGVWSGHDWFNEDEGVGVKNGTPYG